jgi:hypothetical protein
MNFLTKQSLLLFTISFCASSYLSAHQPQPLSSATAGHQARSPRTNEDDSLFPARRCSRVRSCAAGIRDGISSAASATKKALIDAPIGLTRRYLAAPAYKALPPQGKSLVDAIMANPRYQAIIAIVGVGVVAQYALVQMNVACDFLSPEYSSAACKANLEEKILANKEWAKEMADRFVTYVYSLIDSTCSTL